MEGIQNHPCSCGSGEVFVKCCRPLISGEVAPRTAEALMRSRYTAFCHQEMNYVRDTTHPKSRRNMDEEGQRTWAEKAQFQKLEILKASQMADTAFVEFKAHYAMDGDVHVHHEISNFRREKGRWYFLSGRTV